MQKDEVIAILEKNYFGEHPHERLEIEALPALFRAIEPNVFVDVGASLGQYSRVANGLMSGGRIVMCEPDPIRREYLEIHSGVFDERNEVVITPFAIGARDEEVLFNHTRTNTSGSLLSIAGRVENCVRIPTLQRSLDSLLGDFLKAEQKIFVKMDIEGGEYRALSGMSACLESERFNLLVEVHSWGDTHIGMKQVDFLGVMKAKELKIYKIGNHYLFRKLALEVSSNLRESSYIWEMAQLRLKDWYRLLRGAVHRW